MTNRLGELNSEFNPSVLEFLENGGSEDGLLFDGTQTVGINASKVNGRDELYNDALSIVTESRAASASMLQRRLKVGKMLQIWF